MAEYLPAEFVVNAVFFFVLTGVVLYYRKKKSHTAKNIIHNATNTEQVSKAELWDAYSLKFLENHRHELRKSITKGKQHLSNILNRIKDEKHTPVCPSDKLTPSCASLEKMSDNYDSFNQALKKHCEINKREKKLRDYLRKRKMDEAMKQWMNGIGANAYDILEISVLCLIMLVLTLLFYELYTPAEQMSAATRYWIAGIDIFACCVFQFEFFARMRHAQNKLWYWKKHWIDFISSFPVAAMYLLPIESVMTSEWLRLLRLGRIIRALRIASYLWRGMERLEQVADIDMMKKSLVYMCLAIFLGGLALYAVEGPNYQTADTKPVYTNSSQEKTTGVAVKEIQVSLTQGANTQDEEERQYATQLDKTLWWSATTLATGGYGDLYKPKTLFGWTITFIIILVGVVVVAIFTASLTSVFQGHNSDPVSKQIEKHHLEVVHLLNALQTRVAALEAATADGTPGTKEQAEEVIT